MKLTLLLTAALAGLAFAKSPFQSHHRVNGGGRPVPVDLFVMSKCPDKVVCEAVIADVLKQVDVPVKLDISYIATPNRSEPLQFSCMHGPTECLGNIQELCFKHAYHRRDNWFNFDLCLNEDYKQIGIDKNLPRHCAQQQRKSYLPVNSCVHGKLGIKLLRESVKRTHKFNATTSCTIFVNDKLRCIHDGTWKQCNGGYEVQDFVKTIEDAYHERKSLDA